MEYAIVGGGSIGHNEISPSEGVGGVTGILLNIYLFQIVVYQIKWPTNPFIEELSLFCIGDSVMYSCMWEVMILNSRPPRL